MKDAVPKVRKPSIRLTKNGFLAEITRSRAAIGNIFHYIIQNEGSPEILAWGQERSLKDARSCVREFIEREASRKLG